MALGKLPVSGHTTIWMTVGQGPVVLAIGAGGGCLDIFTLVCPFSPLSPSLWETARYRLKYSLKGPLNPKQPTNQPTSDSQENSNPPHRRSPASLTSLLCKFRVKMWKTCLNDILNKSNTDCFLITVFLGQSSARRSPPLSWLFILTTAEIYDYCMVRLGHKNMPVDSKEFFRPGR